MRIPKWQRRLARHSFRRVKGRVTGVVLAAVTLVAMSPSSASAHDRIEEALARGAGPADWVYIVVAALALAGSGVVMVARLLQGRNPGSGPALRHWPMLANLLLAWVLLGVVQAMASRSSWSVPGWLWGAGYLLLPTALVATWFVVVANFRAGLAVVLRRARYRWLAGAVAMAYLTVALWAGNMVAVPEGHDMPPAGAPAFVAVGWTHGPLAAWPTLEVWLPSLRLFGALSAGMVSVLVTVAALMGLAWSAGIYAVNRQRTRRHATTTGVARLTGLGAVGTAGLNVCCCCAPAMYPVLALLVGPATGASVSAWFLGSSSPLYDVGLVAMITLTTASLASLLRRAESATSAGAITPVRVLAAGKLPVG
jgi:hypothetical protein